MSPTSVPQRAADWTRPLGDYLQSVSWSADGRWIAAALSSGPIALLESDGQGEVVLWKGHEGGCFSAAFSPTGSRLASVGQDGTARLWEPGRSEPCAVVEAGASWVEQLAWAPDGSQFAVSAGRKVLTLAPDGTILHQFAPRRSTVTALTWRADSQFLAAASYGEVQRWRTEDGALEEPLPWKTSLISLAWSPDGQWMVAGTQEQSVQIWRLPFRSGEELAMSGYPGKVRELAWHQDSRYLATGGGSEIMVWDCAGSGPAGTTPRILDGHEQRVTALAYQQAGHLLASGSEEGRILLWNAGRSSTALRQFQIPAPITALSWSRDDRRLAVSGGDGTLAVITPGL